MPKKLTQAEQATAEAYVVQEAVDNCAFFIRKFVFIEDRTTAQIAISFQLWPNQLTGLETIEKNRLVVGLKARQLGFTWLAVARAVWVMLKPGKSVLALSKTEEDAKELVRRAVFILRYLPGWMMRRAEDPRDKGMMWFEYTATTLTVHHPNAEDSTFKSFPAGANSGRSFTGNLLIIDEWAFQDYAREIWEAAFPTINSVNGGQVIGISTMKLGTLFEEIVTGALTGTNDFKVIFWPWNTDPSRNAEWYERAKRTLGDAVCREYPATIEEAFTQAAGRFFPEVRKDIHIKPRIEKIPENYRRYGWLDYGLDMFYFGWAWIDADGYSRGYRELKKQDLIIREAAKLVIKENRGELLHGIFAPPDMWNRRQDTKKSFAASFAEYGLFLTKSDARREQGWQATKELTLPVEKIDPQTEERYMTARFTIDESDTGEICAMPYLWECLTKIQREDDEQHYNDISDKNHYLTHPLDAFRYFATGRSLRAIVPMVGHQQRSAAHPFLPEDFTAAGGGFVQW